ncbi:MAG: peptidase C39 [Clostridiales bacterium]|nr:peptidase C39 [Clostridiales bacterium]
MKNDLISQSSEFDCGPTSLVNAIRFLYEREEVPPAVLKHIWAMGNDTFNEQGHPGKHGTSKASMRYMAEWLNAFGRGCGFPIRARFLELDGAVITPGGDVWACLTRGGCAVMRCHSGGYGHYVLLTAILSETELGLFDPYDEEPEPHEEPWRCVADEPKRMNRAVDLSVMNRFDKADYAMGKREEREILLVERGETHEA